MADLQLGFGDGRRSAQKLAGWAQDKMTERKLKAFLSFLLLPNTSTRTRPPFDLYIKMATEQSEWP